MKHFALSWTGATVKELSVTAHATSEAAATALAGDVTVGGVTGVAVSGVDDLAKLSGPALAMLFNRLIDKAVEGDNSEKHVARFKDRESGAKRVFDLLETHFKDAPEAAAPSTGNTSAAESSNEEDMATKGKKSTKKVAKKTAKPKTPKAPKAPKAPKEKKVRAPRVPKDRNYKAEVVSKGSEKAKASALELIQRANGATADEIKERLGVSLGTAKNLVWYLRRDGHKIVVDRAKERKPYVIK